MAKSIIIILSLLLASCGGSGGSGGSNSSNRDKIIQGLMDKGFNGPVPSFDGQFIGKCAGKLSGAGQSWSLSDCELRLVYTEKSETEMSIEVEVYFAVEGDYYGRSIYLDDLKIDGNKIITLYDQEETIGEIGSVGFGIKGEIGFMQFLGPKSGTYYFDGTLFGDNNSKIQVKADLKKSS